MTDTPLRLALTTLRDHLLAAPSCFDRGYAPARADLFRTWTWEATEAVEIGPADHRGPYFYLKLRGPLRYRLAKPTAACRTNPHQVSLPLRLVALAPCADPFALERWLRHRLLAFAGGEPRLLAVEIDPLRAFRLERGPEAPLPEAFHAGRWAILALDFDLDWPEGPPPCPDDLTCIAPWPTACAERLAPNSSLD
jgi:hypothetical protein